MHALYLYYHNKLLFDKGKKNILIDKYGYAKQIELMTTIVPRKFA